MTVSSELICVHNKTGRNLSIFSVLGQCLTVTRHKTSRCVCMCVCVSALILE